MQQVSWMDLIPGKSYRVEHAAGLLQPRLATFINNINLGGEFLGASLFNNIIMSDGTVYDPGSISGYRSDEWIFFETGNKIMSNQVARGLSNRVGENAAGIIQRMLIGNKPTGSGPNRYPSRIKSRKNRKTRKSRR
jgi:hypothetical protein